MKFSSFAFTCWLLLLATLLGLGCGPKPLVPGIAFQDGRVCFTDTSGSRCIPLVGDGMALLHRGARKVALAPVRASEILDVAAGGSGAAARALFHERLQAQGSVIDFDPAVHTLAWEANGPGLVHRQTGLQVPIHVDGEAIAGLAFRLEGAQTVSLAVMGVKRCLRSDSLQNVIDRMPETNDCIFVSPCSRSSICLLQENSHIIVAIVEILPPGPWLARQGLRRIWDIIGSLGGDPADVRGSDFLPVHALPRGGAVFQPDSLPAIHAPIADGESYEFNFVVGGAKVYQCGNHMRIVDVDGVEALVPLDPACGMRLCMVPGTGSATIRWSASCGD